MYSDLGFLDSGEPPRTPFFSLQSPVPRFESGRRLRGAGPGGGRRLVPTAVSAMRPDIGPAQRSLMTAFLATTTPLPVVPLAAALVRRPDHSGGKRSSARATVDPHVR